MSIDKRKNQRAGIKVWAENNNQNEVALWLGEEFKNLPEFTFCYSTRNISSSGIFLETKTPLDLESLLELEFTLPPDNVKIEITGKVVHINEEGMGIEFIDMDEEVKVIIDDFVEKNS
ncbi:PilZ domain-containing protein [bacterium]|nr:PilZ domain-containing protein [bacterium]